ncbi:DUF397 domain-containing protein [Kitasatospora sp. NPDC058965]|uniref:DUF397 domain-containing protein n=1 Tax=Kitasatospora sp. NPDC058965 TaxID=3346682 RepID=UPI003685CC01
MTHRNAPQWRKSTFSDNGGECVEIAPLPSTTAVRDSKDPDGPALLFPSPSFAAFLEHLRVGQWR